MIMVSGWMEEPEDDKRTFGVIPDKMSIKATPLNGRHLYAAYAPDDLACDNVGAPDPVLQDSRPGQVRLH
jgi:hypothetical protein